MILYTTVGVSDLRASVDFYGAIFDLMGLERCWLDETSASWGRTDDPDIARFSIGYPFEGRPSVGNGTMTAFRIAEPSIVDLIHQAVLDRGGRDEGRPGRRPRYGGDFYGAYVRDPDGNKLAFICNTPADI